MSSHPGPQMRRLIHFRDHWQCILCGSTRVIQVHHIVPVSEGGPDQPYNLVTLCDACHNRGHKEGFETALLFALADTAMQTARVIERTTTNWCWRPLYRDRFDMTHFARARMLLAPLPDLSRPAPVMRRIPGDSLVAQ